MVLLGITLRNCFISILPFSLTSSKSPVLTAFQHEHSTNKNEIDSLQDKFLTHAHYCKVQVYCRIDLRVYMNVFDSCVIYSFSLVVLFTTTSLVHLKSTLFCQNPLENQMINNLFSFSPLNGGLESNEYPIYGL